MNERVTSFNSTKLRNNKTDRVRSDCLSLVYRSKRIGGMDDLDDGDDWNRDEVTSDAGRWLLMFIRVMLHLNFEDAVELGSRWNSSMLIRFLNLAHQGPIVVHWLSAFRLRANGGTPSCLHLSRSCTRTCCVTYWSRTFCDNGIFLISRSLRTFSRSSAMSP